MGVWARIRNLFRTDADDYVNETDSPDGDELKSDMSQTVISALREEEAEQEVVPLGKKPSLNEVKSYIDANCGRMHASRQQNAGLKREYEKVTGYLKDIELIEAMDRQMKSGLIKTATEIVELKKEQNKSRKKKVTISDANYKTMKQYEDRMNQELVSLKKREKFQMNIKSDMRYLDSEKTGLMYERKERLARNSFFRTMSIGLSVIIISLFIFLLVLGIYSRYDMTIPFIIVIAASGLLILYIFMGTRKNRYESALIDRKLARAVNLMNSAKIKYINNTALLDYIYAKYGVKDADELEYVWGQYLRIREEEERDAANKERIDELEEKLFNILKEQGISDTNVWSSQVVALIESKEMVEVRHKLNVRRGKLREQIAYNDDVFEQSANLLVVLMKDKEEYSDMVIEGVTGNGVINEFSEFAGQFAAQ